MIAHEAEIDKSKLCGLMMLSPFVAISRVGISVIMPKNMTGCYFRFLHRTFANFRSFLSDLSIDLLGFCAFATVVKHRRVFVEVSLKLKFFELKTEDHSNLMRKSFSKGKRASEDSEKLRRNRWRS